MRSRWTTLVPAVLLVAVTATQWVRTAVTPQSPWIGAGFGMFATVDGADRMILIRDRSTGDILGTPAFDEEDYGSTIRVPTSGALTAMLDRIETRFDRAVRLEVLAPDYDAATDHLTWRTVASHP